jgi:predicted Zn finger-like uncharacterized protein
MRLICPNCDAQYEVDDSAIPEGGRDVQCSNCGHGWFQLPAGLAEEIEAEEELFGAPSVEDAPWPVAPSAVSAATEAPPPPPDRVTEPDRPASEPAFAAPQSQELDEAQEAVDTPPAPPEVHLSDAEAEPAPPPDATIPRRALDESLLAVLKEEAEREAAARRAERRPIETQTDLGLEETGNAAALRERLARLRAPDPEAEPEVTDRPAARRDLLPDIEEINSTLRASSENRSAEDLAAEQPTAARGASGFRSGFFLMLFLAVIATAAYVAAPRISQQFPAAEGAMTSYVNGVNRLRSALDGLMLRATGGLQSMGGN